MNNYTLGLDLGPTSIGWALVNEKAGKIIKTGVRIFPEGVARTNTGAEMSKNQVRREARSRRRLLQRRRRRLANLKAFLISKGLLPSDESSYALLLKLDPYELRKRALDEKVSPHELGRIFIHLGQRKGFLSNRKTDSDEEEKGIKKEMGELQANIEAEQCRTLGEYLYFQDQNFDHTHFEEGQKNIRSRHTRRDMFEHEFEFIWKEQQVYHPKLLTEDLKYGPVGFQNYPSKRDKDSLMGEASQYGVHGILFFQRAMYWSVESIGKCELEKNKLCAPKADRRTQRIRIVQEVSNLRYTNFHTDEKDKELTLEQKKKLVSFLWLAKEKTFKSVKKELSLPEQVVFNFEDAKRLKLKGNETDALLRARKKFGKDWDLFSDEDKTNIVALLIDDYLSDREVETELKKFGLSEDEIEKVMSVSFPTGRTSYSVKAMENLLPFLEEGMPLMGEDETNCAIIAAGYLRRDQYAKGTCELLPKPPELPNPIVNQALTEVRKVVNALIKKYAPEHNKKDNIDTIRVELARDAKNGPTRRKELFFDNRKREKERERVKKELEEYLDRPSREDINRYLLWEQQNKTCVYCGVTIGLEQLISGGVDVDHILPRWRSLDDSMANKVTVHRACNDEKGDRTPREWLEATNIEQYELMINNYTSMLSPYKRKKFSQEKIVVDEFAQRQLNDTKYISREVKEYLKTLGCKVTTTKGQLTAELRRLWGLNSILNNREENKKSRDDHRHHAVDALVIALMNENRIHNLAHKKGEPDQPWETFRFDAKDSINELIVSHKVVRGINGSLFEESILGTTQKVSEEERVDIEKRPWAKDWEEDEGTFVIRKNIEDITTLKQLEAIRDKAIRERLKTHLKNLNGSDTTIPKGSFSGCNMPRMASGVPIKKVRMLKRSKTTRQISERRNFQYSQTGNNHHMSFFEIEGKSGVKAVCTTMCEVADRNRRKLPLITKDIGKGYKFLASFAINEAFTYTEKGEEKIGKVIKTDSGRATCVSNTDSKPSNEREIFSINAKQFVLMDVKKVTVNMLGELRWAND